MIDKLNEQDVALTLQDFEAFCSYLEKNRPKLTKAREELGKKDSFALNALLSTPREVDGPKYLMPTYPTINLYFSIALMAGLFDLELGKGDHLYLIPSENLQNYRSLHPINQYLLLLKTFWTQLDFGELYFDTLVFRPFEHIQQAFEVLWKAEPGIRIFADLEDFQRVYDVTNPVHRFFVGAGMVVAHFSALGFWNYEEAHLPKSYESKKDIDVKAITPTRLGIQMIQGLRKRPCELYNKFEERERPQSVRANELFEEAFVEFFPEGLIDSKAIDSVLEGDEPISSQLTEGNAFVFKVSLDKKIWRKILISGSHSLEKLHRAILEAFELSEDHLYAFFMDGRPWSRNVYWAKEDGTKPSADQASLKSLGLVPGQKFLYLYDFGDEWQFAIQLMEVQNPKAIPLRPVVIEKKGDFTGQYFDTDELPF